MFLVRIASLYCGSLGLYKQGRFLTSSISFSISTLPAILLKISRQCDVSPSPPPLIRVRKRMTRNHPIRELTRVLTIESLRYTFWKLRVLQNL